MSDTTRWWPRWGSDRSRLLGLVAIGIAVAVVVSLGTGLDGIGSVRVPGGGLELLGLFGLTRRDDLDASIDRLATATERLEAGGDDVDLETDRSDEVGRLAEAISDLATACRERDQQLERQQAYTDAVLDGVTDVFCVVDRDGTLRDWNSAFSEVTGYTDADIGSMHVTEFVAGASDRLADALETGRETGAAHAEISLATTDGPSIPYEIDVRRVEDPDETPVVALTGRDVTDRHEQERVEMDAAHQDLSRIMADTSLSRTAQIDRLLELGCEQFGVDTAVVARIDDSTGQYRIEAAAGSRVVDDDIETELAKTVCRRTTEMSDAIVTSDTVGEGDVDERLHQNGVADKRLHQGRDTDDPIDRGRGIGCYLGGEIRVDGDRYGALCFFDREPREVPFSAAETEFAELLTRWTSAVYERREHEHERQWKARAIDAAPIGLTITDPTQPDNPIVYANEAFAETTGYPIDDCLGRNCRFLQGEGTDPDTVEQLRAAVAAEEPASVELRNYRRDDTPFWNHIRIAPVTDDADELTHFVGFQQDVTERTRTERQLSTLMSNIPGMVYRCRNEPDWPFEFVSQGCVELTGYEPGLLVDGDVEWSTDVIDGGTEELWETIQQALAAGESFQATYAIETADGERRWVSEQGRGVVDENGSVEALEGVMIDVTDRIESERELDRTRQLLTQAQQLANVGAWELDVTSDPYEQEWSDEVSRIHGLPTDSDVGLDDAVEFYTPAARENLEPALDRAINAGESYDLELRIRRADGELRWVRTIGDPVMEDGEIVSIRGSIQDVTEHKERERELELTSDLLQETQRIACVGGWELDLRSGPPYQGMFTDELYQIHELPLDAEFDHEDALEFYHPADQPRLRSALEAAIEDGESYDLEARLITANGTERWVQTSGKPIVEDGDTIKLRGTVQDITERKEYEIALESLHETARGLLQAESASAVAELVVETATEVLDVCGVSVYRLDAGANTFEPAAYSPGFVDVCGGTPSVSLGDDDSVLWDSFITGSQTVVDDASMVDRSPLFGSDVQGGLVMPIGDHGVFVFVAEPSTFDEEMRQLVETLAATTEAAFDRLASEASLRERDAELEAQNSRLKRQIGINEIIRSIDQSLVRATSRTEIERTVCQRLTETEDIAFAWIGSVDATETAVEPRAWAGDGETYLDAVSLSTDTAQPEPAVTTALTETSTVVSNVVANLQSEPWRKTALATDFASCLCVPIAFDEYSYGVLAVYATEPDTFGDLERTVFEELGENIANSITAVQTRHALYADTLLELTLEFDDSDAFLAQIARETGATVEYEGVATHSADETCLFITTDGADPTAVETVLDTLLTVTDWQLVSETDADTNDRCLFEVTVTETELVSRLLRHGASPRSITVTGTTLEIVIDVSPTTDVREFVEMLAQTSPSVELAGRRNVERTMHTRGELVSSLFDPLTDRQLEVLRTAYFAGFFEWPRTSTGEEVAAMLGVSQPTVNRHLRIGQQRLLAGLFGSDEHMLVGDWDDA